ncbi:MAG: nodulation protein NfeD [candidate division NC10 bacterium]|nr:nodulation protein NfeD [candidate division NC10 bacterium]
MTRRVLLAAALGLPLALAAAAAQGPEAPRPVHVIRLEGVIAPSATNFVTTSLKQAQQERAVALVIELDTPGGLDVSMRAIIKEMMASEVPIVVYVSPSGARAASAGAFLTLAAHVAAMAPGTNIGAAHPVQMGGEMDKEMARKVTNDAAAYIRSIAEKRGRNVKWAEDAVRKSVSVTEKEALRLGVIDLVSERLEDLLARIDGRRVEVPSGPVTLRTKGAPLVRIEPSFRDRVLQVISDPTIAYILLLLGLAGLYFEFSTPGAILPGVLGAISLILAFYAFQTLPINYAGLLLIVLAVVLFIAEAMVISHGILTMGGIVAMVLGSIMLIDSPAPYLRIPLSAILAATAGTTAFFVLLVGAGVRAQRGKLTTGKEGLLGMVGVARTRLAPGGLVFVQGAIWSAEASEVVEVGEQVEVVGIDGLKLKVQKVKTDPAARLARPDAPATG